MTEPRRNINLTKKTYDKLKADKELVEKELDKEITWDQLVNGMLMELSQK